MEKEFLLEWPPPLMPSLSHEDHGPIRKKLKKEQGTYMCIPVDVVSPDELKFVRKDPNIEVCSLLAQWWKWKQQNNDRCSHLSLPPSTNPNTVLHHILKLSSAQKFLKLRISFLEEEPDENIATLATCHYLFGNTKEAMHCMQHVVNTDCSKEMKWRWHLIRKQYTVLMRQEELVKCLKMTTLITLPQSTKVERRDASGLSFKEFFHNYAMTHTPLIITGLEISSSIKWTLHYIKKVIGHRTAPLRQHVPGSVEWAKLEPCGHTNISEFIDNLDKQDKASLKYLFDWSIPLHCPELMKELIIPKYFSGDLLQQTLPGSLYQDSWPSLFISPAGITSDLHVDAFGSNFWMALFEGRKRWIFFPPEDLPCLYPQYHMHSTDAVFGVTLSNLKEDHPLVTMTHPRECILEPGEILFVPASCPHQVENLEISLAISTNFVDLSNIEQTLEELRINSLVDPRADQLLVSLSKLSLPFDELQKDLPWKEFKQTS